VDSAAGMAELNWLEKQTWRNSLNAVGGAPATWSWRRKGDVSTDGTRVDHFYRDSDFPPNS